MSEVERLAWTVQYGIRTAEEALAKPELTPAERAELRHLLAEELANGE